MEVSGERIDRASWSRLGEALRAVNCIGHLFKKIKTNLFIKQEIQVLFFFYRNIRKYREALRKKFLLTSLT